MDNNGQDYLRGSVNRAKQFGIPLEKAPLLFIDQAFDCLSKRRTEPKQMEFTQ
jgi:hypothetical protein